MAVMHAAHVKLKNDKFLLKWRAYVAPFGAGIRILFVAVQKARHPPGEEIRRASLS